MRKDDFFNIKVTNVKSNFSYFHKKVPYEHIEILKMSPNLEVEILSKHRERYNEREIIKEINSAGSVQP